MSYLGIGVKQVNTLLAFNVKLSALVPDNFVAF